MWTNKRSLVLYIKINETDEIEQLFNYIKLKKTTGKPVQAHNMDYMLFANAMLQKVFFFFDRIIIKFITGDN